MLLRQPRLAARILSGAWSALRDARNLCSGLAGQGEADQA